MCEIIESDDNFLHTMPNKKLFSGYSDWSLVIINNEKSILADLKKYEFSNDIKNKADVIYSKMKYQVRRGKIRFQMLFFCVYCAHLELNVEVNPIHLGSLFGLTKGEVQRCDSIFSPLQTGYKPPPKITSPLGYLPNFCEILSLSPDAINDITELGVKILTKDKSLYQENPQTVAAGLLRYYTITNGIILNDPQKLTSITGRSNVTIDVMYRRISSIDNK